METTYKMLYCTWECALCCGNPEPLAEYTREMFSIHNNKIPQWLVERLGNSGVAYVAYASITKDKNKSKELYRLGGWIFTEYFNRTGDFKNYDKEWIYYVFYGIACYKVGGISCFSGFGYDMSRNVPEVYVNKVINAWDTIGIGK